jgi:hypothetical protein
MDGSYCAVLTTLIYNPKILSERFLNYGYPSVTVDEIRSNGGVGCWMGVVRSNAGSNDSIVLYINHL